MCIAKPGTMIVVPSGWFHSTLNLDDVIALSGEVETAATQRMQMQTRMRGRFGGRGGMGAGGGMGMPQAGMGVGGGGGMGGHHGAAAPPLRFRRQDGHFREGQPHRQRS